MSSTKEKYDFTYSNLILMIGGQILALALIIMIILFGVGPIRWSVNQAQSIVKPFIQKTQSLSSSPSSPSSSSPSSSSSSST